MTLKLLLQTLVCNGTPQKTVCQGFVGCTLEQGMRRHGTQLETPEVRQTNAGGRGKGCARRDVTEMNSREVGGVSKGRNYCWEEDEFDEMDFEESRE
ncbi:hypothetical protein L596_026359 [Steinernema carpocapsae]|uniref:Uncharacterized protein n=1 Tax=Steinernema carpocapsae TaxID=34508 RepID=A0A4V5ZY59_STECR|nr:hypothetical protein L596_026359 [Steinernema carpocapsae]